MFSILCVSEREVLRSLHGDIALRAAHPRVGLDVAREAVRALAGATTRTLS